MKTQSSYIRWVQESDNRWILKFKPYYEEYDYIYLENAGGEKYICDSLDMDSIVKSTFWESSLEAAQKFAESLVIMHFEQELDYVKDLLTKFTS